MDSPNLGFPCFNFLGGYQLKKTPCIIVVDLHLIIGNCEHLEHLSDVAKGGNTTKEVGEFCSEFSKCEKGFEGGRQRFSKVCKVWQRLVKLGRRRQGSAFLALTLLLRIKNWNR